MPTRGFIGLDWAKFRADSGCDQAYANPGLDRQHQHRHQPRASFRRRSRPSTWRRRAAPAFGNRFARHNLGLRHARTEQTFGTLISTADPRNAQLNLGDGGLPEPHHGRADAHGLQ